jgi:hypothetical protein
MLAVCLLPASSFIPRAHGPPRHQTILHMSKKERDLKVMNLVELKELAESMGIAEPEGHKGRKKTWIKAILDAPSSATAASADPPADPPAAIPAATPAAAALSASRSEKDLMMAFLRENPNQLGALAALCQPGAPAEEFLNEMVSAGAASVPAPPEDEAYGVGDGTRDLLGKTMEFLQESLLVFGDVESNPEEDPSFIAEGRRILALERFPVREAASETFLMGALWTEIAGLVAAGPNKGTLMLLPKYSAGDIKAFVEDRVRPALGWLGLGRDVLVEGYRMSQGAPCPLVRVLHKVDVDAVEYEGDEDGPVDLSEDLIGAVKADAKDYAPIGEDVAAKMKKKANAEKAEEAKAAKAAAKAFAEAEAEVEVGPALAIEEKERPNNLTDLLMNKVNPRWLFRK